MRAQLLLSVLTLLLTGCATTAPDAITQAPANDISLAQVRGNVEQHIAQPVRWGGTIAGVENRPDETWLDIVARPLGRSGRPQESGESDGRFLAKVKGFLDPAVYTKGREVTVAGNVAGKLTRPIGEFPYTYVVVSADTTKLWERPTPRSYYYRDPFYDPFYDPFWPARVYPWYAPYPFYPYWR